MTAFSGQFNCYISFAFRFLAEIRKSVMCTGKPAVKTGQEPKLSRLAVKTLIRSQAAFVFFCSLLPIIPVENLKKLKGPVQMAVSASISDY